MCTFQDEHNVMVCDVAIGHVKKMQEGLGDGVRYTVVDGQGTLVEAEPNVDGRKFTELAREAISSAQSVQAHKPL